MPKMGRPTDNPKDVEKVTVRLDRETSTILYSYCEKKGIGKAEAIRQGIKKLEKE